MALVRYIEYAEASAEVRAIYDDIMRSRGVDWVNNFWKALANRPAELRLMELLAVAGLANETNRLANGLRVDVDPQFK
jgi:hypothetical protein